MVSTVENTQFFLTLGQKIATERKAAGFSQAKLAQNLGITQQNLALYETGQRRIALPTLFRISEALQVSIDELLPIQQQTTRRRGPAPRLLRQLERVQALPEDKQRLISDLIDSLAGSEQSSSLKKLD